VIFLVLSVIATYSITRHLTIRDTIDFLEDKGYLSFDDEK